MNDAVEQGDLLKVTGLTGPVMVVSNDFFNESGKAIVCPIVKNAVEGPLHIRLKDSRRAEMRGGRFTAVCSRAFFWR